MPQTKTQPRKTPPRAPARKASASRASASRERVVKKEQRQASPVDRTTELSEEVLRSIESGQRAAIEAVRKFVDTVDMTLPALGERPSRRQEIVDAALEMADRLVHTQYDFLHKIVHSAGKALSGPDEKK